MSYALFGLESSYVLYEVSRILYFLFIYFFKINHEKISHVRLKMAR